MSQPTEPAPPRLSFGVELEFAVLYVFGSNKVVSSAPPGKYFDDGLPQPLEIPYPAHEKAPDLDNIAQYTVEKAIRDTLEAAGFPVQVAPAEPTDTVAEQRLDQYRHWQVGRDVSVSAIDIPKYEEGIRAASIEIGTPVEWDSPLAFEAVRYAVNLLASQFRIQVNTSTGMHVHVGNGPAFMPYQWVKRMAMLCWAADRLLATLNPPTRSWNFFCPGIRDFSRLARNELEDEPPIHLAQQRGETFLSATLKCEPYVATDVRFGERSTLWRETHAHEETVARFGQTRLPGHFEPFIDENAPVTCYPSAARHEDPQVPLDQYTHNLNNAPSNVSSDRSSPQPIDKTRHKSVDLTQAELAEKTAALEDIKARVGVRKRINGFQRLKLPRWTEEDLRNIDDVNQLNGGHDMSSWGDPAIDRGVWFGVERIAQTKASCQIDNMLRRGSRYNYNFRSYECGPIGNTSVPSKRTVEWRQAAGSMDGKWVSVWSRIVVGVSRFAVHAPVDEFLRILTCCDYAEKGGSYDVLDLLEDMGLVAEAEVAGQRIWDDGDKWGLEYE
ncbi:hypothetical protein SCUP234_07672 [Seiridium cupressi]